jgi:hypothetical protein
MFKASKKSVFQKTMRSVAILALAGSAAAFAPMGTPPLRKVQIFLSYSAFFLRHALEQETWSCAISSRPPGLGVSVRNFMGRDCGQHAFERRTPAYSARTYGCMHAFKYSRCRRGTCDNFYTIFTSPADLAASLSHTRRACSMNALLVQDFSL